MSSTEVTKRWLLIDADGMILGRLAVIIANLLRGKHKPSFAPNADDGDNVVVINALKVKMTGKKMTDDVRYRHTGHPGGIKTTTPKEILNGPFPEQLIIKAVKNMIPSGPLGRAQMKHLFVYGGASHDQEAQQPELLDIGKLNPKNKFDREGSN